MIKKLLLVILSIMILFSYHTLAADNNSLNWQKAVLYMDRNNNTLLDMKQSVEDAWENYKYAVLNAENIDTLGMSVSFMGMDWYIVYEPDMRMMMTQQKEIFPEQMKLNWEMTKNSSVITRNHLIAGLRSMYFGLYSAQNDYSIKIRKHELQQSIHKQNEIKHQRGLISDMELEESEYNLMASEAAANASGRNLENMMRSFNAYLGVDLDIVYDSVSYNEKYDEGRLRQLDYYIGEAVEKRFEIVSKVKQLELLERRKKIMEDYPLSMNKVRIRKDYEDLLDSIEETKLQLDAERLMVEKDIKQAYIDVMNTEKNVISMKKMVDLQSSNFESMKARYDAGLISKTVIDQAQIAYDEMEQGYLATLFDYNTRLMRLENAAGLGPAYQEG